MFSLDKVSQLHDTLDLSDNMGQCIWLTITKPKPILRNLLSTFVKEKHFSMREDFSKVLRNAGKWKDFKCD